MKHVAIALLLPLLAAACGNDPAATPGNRAADHGHDHDDDHDHNDHDHSHAGTPHVLHDAAVGPWSRVVVTFLRPLTAPVDELVFEVEVTGPTVAVRGTVHAANGATSLTVKADAEAEPGSFHVHVSELPEGLDAGGARLVLELAPESGEAQVLELSLDA